MAKSRLKYQNNPEKKNNKVSNKSLFTQNQFSFSICISLVLRLFWHVAAQEVSSIASSCKYVRHCVCAHLYEFVYVVVLLLKLDGVKWSMNRQNKLWLASLVNAISMFYFISPLLYVCMYKFRVCYVPAYCSYVLDSSRRSRHRRLLWWWWWCFFRKSISSSSRSRKRSRLCTLCNNSSSYYHVCATKVVDMCACVFFWRCGKCTYTHTCHQK